MKHRSVFSGLEFSPKYNLVNGGIDMPEETNEDLLNQLLDGDESYVSEWLSERDLLHECYCVYTVYDPEEVNQAVQDEYGDERCKEIFDWACNLSNRWGWVFIEQSEPEFGIYHCQHCADSEWSLFLDLEKKTSLVGMTTEGSDDPAESIEPEVPREFIAYIDESYDGEFPRKVEGAYSLGALIIPKAFEAELNERVADILRSSYRGRHPRELKHSKIKKSPRLLKVVGEQISDLLKSSSDIAVIGYYMPREGFFGEKVRSIRAVDHYQKKESDPAEISEVLSEENIEIAVKDAANQLAEALANMVSYYIANTGSTGTLIFDPRTTQADDRLLDSLRHKISILPLGSPHVRHNQAIVGLLPTADDNRIGDRIKCEIGPTSEECFGLQVADFLAGDIRTFFAEATAILDEATSEDLVAQDRSMFPKFYDVHKLSAESLRYLHVKQGRSFLPEYREKLANGLISCCTKNGQLRHVNTATGEVLNLVD
jgi:hypothetical protein